MKGKLSKDEVVELISSELVNKLPLEENHKFETRSPVELLTPNRFDVWADTIYAKYHLLDVAKNWSYKIYYDCKSIMGENQADPFNGKSIKTSLAEFHEQLSQIKSGRFPEDRYYLPINQDNVIIDSAHQFATLLLFDQPVKAIRFQYPHIEYDYKYFLEQGLDQDVADAMALAFSQHCPNMAVVVVFPIASGKNEEINQILFDYGRVAYEKEILLTKFGQYNLIQMLYFNMHWIDPDGDINYGVRHHVDHRFWKEGPVKFIFVVFDDISTTAEVKTRLRALFDVKNFSVHINDTHEETIWIAEHILTPNSDYFMNHAQPWLSKKFLQHIKVFKKEIESKGLNKDHFCLTGNSMLAAFGLRDVNDIDFVYFDQKEKLNFDPGVYPQDFKISREVISIGDLIFDPRNHFYFRGLKIISPHLFREICSKEKTAQYRTELSLVDSLVSESANLFRVWRDLRFLIKIAAVNIFHFDLQRIKNIVPASLRTAVRNVYHLLRGHDDEA